MTEGFDLYGIPLACDSHSEVDLDSTSKIQLTSSQASVLNNDSENTTIKELTDPIVKHTTQVKNPTTPDAKTDCSEIKSMVNFNDKNETTTPIKSKYYGSAEYCIIIYSIK